MGDSEITFKCTCGAEFGSANELITHASTEHGVEVE